MPDDHVKQTKGLRSSALAKNDRQDRVASSRPTVFGVAMKAVVLLVGLAAFVQAESHVLRVDLVDDRLTAVGR